MNNYDITLDSKALAALRDNAKREREIYAEAKTIEQAIIIAQCPIKIGDVLSVGFGFHKRRFVVERIFFEFRPQGTYPSNPAENAQFRLYGPRLKKDGTPGKRQETEWITLKIEGGAKA
jgi:hypothetical protein